MATNKNAGFWIRLWATWIDLLLVYFTLKFFFYLLLVLPVNIYFPFEFTFFALTIVYPIISISLTGKTIGKYLLKIEITKTNGEKLSFPRVFLRESIFKIISGIIFFMGFIWIGFSHSKKGWHDYFSGSKAHIIGNNTLKTRIVKFTAILSFIILSISYFGNMFYWWNFAKSMELPELVAHPYHNRNKSELKEISSLTMADDSLLINWFRKNHETPSDYTIRIASNHSITILGENHGNKTYLDFLNKIIPDLYYKAGIRCIAMEAIPESMNNKIEKLVTANVYDDRLELEIARSQPWHIWGSKGYWDVLKTVWRLNNSIPKNENHMRIVGIDTDWDGPTFALTGIGEDGLKNIPFSEKFKLFTISDDLVKLIYRDEIMAGNIEKEIIEKGDKAIVWIGANHSFINYGQPRGSQIKVIQEANRMGVILYQKYGSKISQIMLHSDNSDSLFLDKLLTRDIYKQGLTPIGFSTKHSPMAMLRDSNSYYYSRQPTVAFSDIAQGYIFIKPSDKFEQCSWMKDYISKEMFAKYKAFYVAKTKGKIKFNNAKEVNDLMTEELLKLK